jgi:hypothetical protein
MKSKTTQGKQRSSSATANGRFCDDREVAEILSDRALFKRLKAGSSDARNRKDRLVPTRRKT